MSNVLWGRQWRPPGYVGPAGPPASRPVVSSVRIERGPGHDVVHVFNRGGKAGTLTVTKGDGDAILDLLLAEREPWP